MKKKARVFFTYLSPKSMVSFVEKDYLILKKHYDVEAYCYSGRKRGLFDLPKMLYGIFTSDINVSWFAYTHAYYAVKISKILKKKSVVIVGGFDVAKDDAPEKHFSDKQINQIKYTLDNADVVAAVSERLRKSALEFTNRSIDLIYHGFDHEHFKPKGHKENLVITVGYVKKDNLSRKGHECFVKSAKYLPDVKFVLIGNHLDDSVDYLKSIASNNVEFTGWVSDEKMLRYMQTAKVYVQVSYHEGFGLSLAEGMLCECIPVVTDKGAIPEVVGDTGYYVSFGDPEATADAIKKAIMFSGCGDKARDRIKELYQLMKREQELVMAIEEIHGLK